MKRPQTKPATENWKKAQDKVKKWLKGFEATRKDFWWGDYPDTYAAGGRIIKEQPSDLWMLFKGNFCLLEVKSSEYKDKFYLKDVRPSQWIGVRRATAAGGYSIFMIVKLPEWQWHIVDGKKLWAMKSKGQAGIRWEQMQKFDLNVDNYDILHGGVESDDVLEV